MRGIVRTTISGVLLDWAGGRVNREHLTVRRDQSWVQFQKEIVPGWEQFVLRSIEPLHPDDRDAAPPYLYPLVARRSGARLLMLSPVAAAVDYALRTVIRAEPAFAPVPIDIESLVREIAQRPTYYVLTSAHARVPAYGNNLSTVAFYGEDVSNADWFCESLPLLTPYSCGIRPVKGRHESLRMASDGGVSFYYPGAWKIDEIETALRFLRENRYLPPNLLDSNEQDSG